MKRSFLLILCMLCMVSFGAEYHMQDNTKKMRTFTKGGGYEQLKLFHVTYDNLSLLSSYSHGSSKVRGVENINLALRGVRGFDTLNAYRAEPDEDLKYSAPGNVDPHKGTLIFWTCGMDYAPGDKKTNGKPRTNIALAELRFGNGKDHISIKIYEFNSHLAALWSSSAAPEVKGYGAIGLCETMLDFPRNQWFQVAVTWTPTHLGLYVNGKLRAKSTMPAKIKLTSKLRMQNDDSFIGIRSKFYDDDHRFATGIDDVMILKRALSDMEVANYYRSLVKGDTGAAQVFSVNFNGVEDLSGKIDKLETVFDFSGLDNKERTLLNAGKLPITHKLTGPDGKIISSGKLDFRTTNAAYIFKNVDKPGKYTLSMQVGKHKADFAVTRPDFSWIGNKIGEEPTIPAVFKDFSVAGRKVNLFKKFYQFGEGPLPEKIIYCGKPLLVKAPELKLDNRKINWKAGKTIRTATNVTFTGKGKAKDCTIDYKTTVEYDGLINFHFTVNGRPVVKSMTLDWQVRKESAEYLLTPALKRAGRAEMVFPVSKIDNQLWLAGEGKGGFCWTTESDANWVYNDREKVLFGDTGTGKCLVKMITKEVKLPEATEYSALFIATPTRPYPKEMRFLAYGAGQRYPRTINSTGADRSSGAYTNVFDIRPGKHAKRFWGKAKAKSLCPYNAAESAVVSTPFALYLQKYGEIPGEYSYNMPYWKVVDEKSGKQERSYHKSISFCNRTMISDYLMYTTKVLLDSPFGSKIGMLNYDLAFNPPCSNEYHGCLKKDRFGRYVKTFVVMSKRKLIERTIRLAHSRGITLSLHAQDRFNPVLHSMGDYWEPGEQHCAILVKNAFALCDGSVPEVYFRSEYNKDVIGTGILMMCSVAQLDYSRFEQPLPSRAAITMMLLYDIEFIRYYLNHTAVFELWDVLYRYNFGDPAVKAHKFYRQNAVKSGNAKVQVTWYEQPGKWKLFAVCNRQKTAQKTVIDFGKTLPANCTLRDEVAKKDIVVKNGKAEVNVLPMSYVLLGTGVK